jgi:outer membrane lipoprotein-sorting protein
MRFLLLCLVLLVVPATYAAKIKTTEDLVAAMQKKYGKSWYKTATFVQKTTNYQPDGTIKVETWYEALSVPGSLRIDFAPVKDGNGILFTNNQIYSFKNGKVDTNRPFVHPLLVLGFDIYKLPMASVMDLLKGPKFDLSVLRQDNWQGRPVYVVGAKPGDLHSPQFWIDKKNLYFVRMLRPAGKDGGKRRRRNSTSTSDLAVAGWRRKLSSRLTIKFAPPKSILRCAPTRRSTTSSLTRNTGRACTGENSCTINDERAHQIQN